MASPVPSSTTNDSSLEKGNTKGTKRKRVLREFLSGDGESQSEGFPVNGIGAIEGGEEKRKVEPRRRGLKKDQEQLNDWKEDVQGSLGVFRVR